MHEFHANSNSENGDDGHDETHPEENVGRHKHVQIFGTLIENEIIFVGNELRLLADPHLKAGWSRLQHLGGNFQNVSNLKLPVNAIVIQLLQILTAERTFRCGQQQWHNQFINR